MLPQILDAARAMWPWEVLAVILAIAYLVLAIRENIFCWPAAIASTGIYTVLMFEVGLYMESGLQVFYIAMALYGWVNWGRGADGSGGLTVSSWPLARNSLAIGAIVAATLLSGFVLERYTNAAMPYVDSFTTWGAVVTTWMVARKILQNWHYWFVIDSVSVYLYVSRGLYLTALLFVLYLILIVVGYHQWRRSMLGSDG